MEEVLQELGFGHYVELFLKEKITPDIIGHLSVSQMEQLGVKDRSEMMKIRLKCLPHGSRKPSKSGGNFEIPKGLLENLSSFCPIKLFMTVVGILISPRMFVMGLASMMSSVC